jgi:hypothetical protein
MGKWLLLAALVPVIMSPTLVVCYELGLNLLAPVAASSLIVSPIKLGDVQPGENRALACAVTNQSSRTVRLLAPKVSCGCLSQSNGATVLAPGQSRTLSFSFVAPESPGTVNQYVLLQSEDFPDLYWKIDVRGQVSADVWAVPAKVDLIMSDRGFAETTVFVHHAGHPLGEIVAGSSEIQIEPLEEKNGIRPIKVVVSPTGKGVSKSGSAALTIMETEDKGKEILRIPVTWRLPSLMAWVPTKLSIVDFHGSVGEIKQTIAIRGLSESEQKRLKVEPLESWVRVDGKNAVGSILQLQLVFDPSAMPERFDQGILRLCLDDHPCETVLAYGRR